MNDHETANEYFVISASKIAIIILSLGIVLSSSAIIYVIPNGLVGIGTLEIGTFLLGILLMILGVLLWEFRVVRNSNKPLYFLLIIAILQLLTTYVLLEIFSFALFEPLTGEPFEFKAISNRRTERIWEIEGRNGKTEDVEKRFILHPFVGYVGNPGFKWFPDHSVNEFGMIDKESSSPPYKRRPNEVVVAVLGGSVAMGMVHDSAKTLSEALRKSHPGLYDKKIVVLPFALSGWKQPQQLFFFQLALLYGFDIDIVLNIDGLNEVGISGANLEQNINPVFPSSGIAGLLNSNPLQYDSNTISILSSIYSLSQKEYKVLDLIQQSAFRYSPFANLIAEFFSKQSRYELLKREAVLQTRIVQSEAFPKEFRGPPYNKSQDNYAFLARVWGLSSEMLYSLCRSMGIVYVHFLQPNHHFEEASEGNLSLDNSSEFPNRKHEILGYRYLIAEGRVLREHGIPFYDMSLIFKDVWKEVYADDQTHIKPKGSDIFMEKIAPIIVSEIRKQRNSILISTVKH